jgi:primase-polymerase (primpol)-like protein
MNSYLASIPQWIVVMLVWNAAKNKWDKIPVDFRTGMPADAHQREVWTTYEQARALATQWGSTYTTGFVLTTQDDLFCLDIDGARQADGT